MCEAIGFKERERHWAYLACLLEEGWGGGGVAGKTEAGGEGMNVATDGVWGRSKLTFETR